MIEVLAAFGILAFTAAGVWLIEQLLEWQVNRQVRREKAARVRYRERQPLRIMPEEDE